MVATRMQPRLLHFLGIGLVVILMPGCHSPGELRGSAPRVVYRPAYQWPETKPLYISGYAGANYGSLNPRRGFTTDLAPAQAIGPPSVTIDRGTWDPE